MSLVTYCHSGAYAGVPDSPRSPRPARTPQPTELTRAPSSSTSITSRSLRASSSAARGPRSLPIPSSPIRPWSGQARPRSRHPGRPGPPAPGVPGRRSAVKALSRTSRSAVLTRNQRSAPSALTAGCPAGNRALSQQRRRDVAAASAPSTCASRSQRARHASRVPHRRRPCGPRTSTRWAVTHRAISCGSKRMK